VTSDPRHFDVLLVTDCRLPGGTSASVAEEIAAQQRLGLRTGLLHVTSPLVDKPLGFNPRLTAAVDEGAVTLVLGRDPVSADLVILRHPSVALALDLDALPPVSTRRAVLVANQLPRSSDLDERHYLPAEARERFASWVGDHVWAPIGPLMREGLLADDPSLPLTPDDWFNIIDVDEWAVDRSDRPHARPVIGRHSRSDRRKWPTDPATLLAAYPADPDIEVAVLGGAEHARHVLRRELPANWRVHRFGALPPQEFLAGIDFFVYFHAPELREAFGRTVLEALASGAVALLPEHFRPLFGDAALYLQPGEVAATVRRLAADPEEYRRRAAHGQRSVRDRFGYESHGERLGRLLDRHLTLAGHPDVPVRPPTVLFVSSNGAGVGHLMRLMSMARRAQTVAPLFLTLSQAVKVVDDLGFAVEYFPSRPYTGERSVIWNAALRRRVVEVIDEHDVAAVVFDGTWPYHGLMDVRDDRPEVRFVWSRRGMWRPEVTDHLLHVAPRFDLVLEPGDLADDDDRGPTVALREEAFRVGPVGYLADDEYLDRTAARTELGLAADATVALVQLGAGNIDDVDSTLRRAIELLGALGIEAVVTRSVISARDTRLPSHVHAISAYPLARYLAAFDLAIAASGYNTFHELSTAAVPTVFIPNLVTSIDDQLARARWAERVGTGTCVVDPDSAELEQALRRFADADERARARDRAIELRVPNGAEAAMAAIEQLVHEGGQGLPRPVSTGGTPARERVAPGPSGPAPAGAGTGRPKLAGQPLPVKAKRLAAWAVATPSVRRVGGRLFRMLPREQQRATRRRLRGWEELGRRSRGSVAERPTRPGLLDSPREVGEVHRVVGVVVEDDRHLAEVVEEVARQQVLLRSFRPVFVARSSDTGPFRRHGFSFELLPREETWQRTASQRTYTSFVRARTRAVLAAHGARAVIVADRPEQVTAAVMASMRRRA
jgi:UDP:flavonoid glycosyltransferase YjiC (YdhE family)/glycosyltransferase involved in cell wall biosynthesis